MSQAYSSFSTKRTPQMEPVPERDQVKNSAGGYVFAIDDWARLHRFLILGSDAPTYYASAKALTRENAECVIRCINANGPRTVDHIVKVSHAGRAPKNESALFALAMALKLGDLETRRAAANALPKVARIGTHLFHLAGYVEQFGGWGKVTREAFANWYNSMPVDRLAYQAIKYQQRDGWSHRDILRLAHPTPPGAWHNSLYHWITQGEMKEPVLLLVGAFEDAKTASEKETIVSIREYGLTREMVRTEHLNSPAIWEALLEKMPLMAMIRNLGKMDSVGLIQPMSEASGIVCSRLRDAEYIKKSRIHPLGVLIALRVYAQGHGMRGSLAWAPDATVIDALDDAFYLAFGNVRPTGKRTMLALDVSGSMCWSNIAGTPITPRQASAAMALVTAKVEPQYCVTAFSHEMVPVAISPRQRLDDVIETVGGIRMGGTDCALPMQYASQEGIDVDTFVIYTDNETWRGHTHPFQALQQYRRATGIPAKLVTVGMTSTGFTIADPDDAGMLDVVGFDTATPQIISGFSAE